LKIRISMSTRSINFYILMSYIPYKKPVPSTVKCSVAPSREAKFEHHIGIRLHLVELMILHAHIEVVAYCIRQHVDDPLVLDSALHVSRLNEIEKAFF
jgi:hypothetical protein